MKQIHIFITTIICLMLLACHSTQEPTTDQDFSGEKKIIIHQMQEQQDAWNRTDIHGFMAHYWNDDSLCFIGKRGLSYGWKTTLENYQKSYPDAAAMGQLQFTNHMVDVMDETHAYVIGKWELFRIADTLSGHYTLLWKKISGKWVIVADHSS
ncbi:MAG: nuclear transport factor 2 family protein [Flavobacteriales bacterium]|nr:nuclear transport factor 2 family protein [Flavobacteriales bacterium]